MTVQATAALLRNPAGPFALEPIDLDDPAGDELLVRIEACGICHTDLLGRTRLPTPSILGHEGVGVVERTGALVHGFAPGDRVVLSFGFCGACPECAGDHAFRCDRSVETNFAGRRLDGGTTARTPAGETVHAAFFQQSSFVTHALAPARSAVKVGRELPPELLAPLGCGVMTGAGTVLNRFRAGPGAGIGVWGAGAVGLSAVMAARLAGLSPIVAVDVVPHRLELARELGATHAFDARDDVTAQVRAIAPRGLPFTLETTGNEQALKAAMESLGMGGCCAMVTVPHRGAPFSFTPAPVFVRAATLAGVFFGDSSPRSFIPELIAHHLAGRFPYDRLVRTYDFAAINRAVDDTASGAVVKPVLLM